MLTDTQVMSPSARTSPTTKPVTGSPVRTVTFVGRSCSGSGEPSSRTVGNNEVKPGLPMSSAGATPTMRAAAALAAEIFRSRS